MRKILIIAALAFTTSAYAQSVQLQPGVPPTLEVQRIAPQLVVFAGGEINFANLVNGLAFGIPVTLTTPLQTGLTEIVTFTPLGAMTPLAIAQTLENARQALIARGVAVPTATQLSTVLAGGQLVTATGTTPVTPLIGTVATVGTVTTSTTPSLLQSGTLRNTSDSLLPRGISDTPPTFTNSQGTPAPLATTPNTNAPFTGGTTTTTTTTTTPAATGGTRPFR